jgi:sialate O-acetylesterase
MRVILLSVVSVFLFCNASLGDISLPRLISDGMVLQRNTNVKIWGWGSPGEKVLVDFNNQNHTAVTDQKGSWTITLSPMQQGGPFVMNITASNKITIRDILIGDVWICSGQSNMALTLERAKDKYADLISQTNNSSIRYFFIPTTFNFEGPQKDLPAGYWESATPDHLLHFSAVGFFYANALFEKYKVPIGLINASVGGSPAEAWLSEEALKKFPQHLLTAKKFSKKEYVDSIRNSDNAARDVWYRTINAEDRGLRDAPDWYDPATDTHDWQEMTIPGYWDEQGLKDINGVVWFRKKINLPTSMTGKPARLFLGNVIDLDSVYINGQFIGTTGYQYPPRKYQVPSTILKAGENEIVVRVINSAGRGGFYKGKPYLLKIDNDTIDLTGSWKFKVGKISEAIPPSTTFQYQPGGLFNGMIAPLLNFSMTGVIWYQGESNAGRYAEYETLFPSMIADWRTHWHQGDFPFLYVQLANYLKKSDQPSESDWAGLREAQRKTLATPNTAMVVAIDVGEWNDIHPLDKKTVGERLSLAAQKVAYGEKNVVYSGPTLSSYTKQGNRIILKFSNTGSGLISRGNRNLAYFSIAGPDKKFVWANAVIKGNQVTVWSDEVIDPQEVRYAWADNPEGANLYNREGLPASPFTTKK